MEGMTSRVGRSVLTMTFSISSFSIRALKRVLVILLTVEAQALGQMALGVQIDHQCSNSHLGQAKSIGGRDTALSGSSFEIEEKLFSHGF